MIVFSDLHLREETEKTVFEQVLPGLIEAAYLDADRTIACLGDFYHLRYRIPVFLQHRVLEFLEFLEANHINFIFLPGNHDQINVQGDHAFEVFRKFPNVQVLTKPQWNKYGYWIPYRRNAEDIAKELEQAMSDINNHTPVLWMHHGIKNALMNSNTVDTKGLPVEMFRHWVVLCGHYHIRQQLGTVRYIGSPYQTKADEAGQVKGYAIWNPNTFDLQWVNTNWGKRYHNLGLVTGDIDLTTVKPGDEVRITVPAGMNTAGLHSALEKAGVSFVVTPNVEVSGSRLPVSSSGSLTDFITAYVDQFAGDLDKSKLLSVFKSISE